MARQVALLFCLIAVAAAAEEPPPIRKLRGEVEELEQLVGRLGQQLERLRQELLRKRQQLEQQVFALRRGQAIDSLARHRPDELVRKLIALLDHDVYATREQATKHLARLGPLGLPELERQRLLARSLEVRTRIDRAIETVHRGRGNLLRPAAGGKLVSFTNQFGPGWTAAMLIDGQISATAWCQQQGAPFRQEFVFSLPGRGAWIGRIGLNNYASGFTAGGVRRFEVLISTAERPGQFIPAGTFTAQPTANAQRQRIQRFALLPVFARHVMLRTLDNHGDPTWVIVNEFEVEGELPLPTEQALREVRAFVERASAR